MKIKLLIFQEAVRLKSSYMVAEIREDGKIGVFFQSGR